MGRFKEKRRRKEIEEATREGGKERIKGKSRLDGKGKWKGDK